MKKSKSDTKINTQEILNDLNLIINNLNSLDYLELYITKKISYVCKYKSF